MSRRHLLVLYWGEWLSRSPPTRHSLAYWPELFHVPRFKLISKSGNGIATKKQLGNALWHHRDPTCLQLSSIRKAPLQAHSCWVASKQCQPNHVPGLAQPSRIVTVLVWMRNDPQRLMFWKVIPIDIPVWEVMEPLGGRVVYTVMFVLKNMFTSVHLQPWYVFFPREFVSWGGEVVLRWGFSV